MLADCEAVLNNKDNVKNMLPTADGFCFGGTNYNEYYFKEIKYTIKIIKSTLKEGGSYYYSSSW